MNVYDFDDTIYKGDSSKDFILFAAKQYPLIMLKMFPKMCRAMILYLCGKIKKKEMKEIFFGFVTQINNIDEVVSRFWDLNQYKIKKWYLKQQKYDDVIISASPRFLLKEICKRLNINYLIATELDVLTGIIHGENCKDEEKVVQFYKKFPNGSIDCFYSDSFSDQYLSQEAKLSFLVKGNRIVKWE